MRQWGNEAINEAKTQAMRQGPDAITLVPWPGSSSLQYSDGWHSTENILYPRKPGKREILSFCWGQSLSLSGGDMYSARLKSRGSYLSFSSLSGCWVGSCDRILRQRLSANLRGRYVMVGVYQFAPNHLPLSKVVGWPGNPLMSPPCASNECKD